MNLLSGGAQAFLGELMTPLYLSATVTEGALSYDAQGDLSRAGTERACLAQVDECTEAMERAEGYTSEDRAIFVLTTSLAGALDTDCTIEILEGEYAGQTFRVAAPVSRDPGAAYWLCRGKAVNSG